MIEFLYTYCLQNLILFYYLLYQNAHFNFHGHYHFGKSAKDLYLLICSELKKTEMWPHFKQGKRGRMGSCEQKIYVMITSAIAFSSIWSYCIFSKYAAWNDGLGFGVIFSTRLMPTASSEGVFNMS